MPTIAFQGELGAYSEEAIVRAFGGAAQARPCREFYEVGEAVSSGTAELGLLPIENTLAGSVIPSYDVLAGGALTVLGEVVIPIHHCVLGLPDATLEGLSRIISHPVALAQCTRFLRSRVGVEAVAVYDTAGAARLVTEKQDPRVAAIAGRAASARYGLVILTEDVEDRHDNQTRFLIVAPEGGALPSEIPAGPPTKSLLIIETENEPGSLVRVLEPFADQGVNLSKIESRPGDAPWTYRFFLEVESDGVAPALTASLAAVRKVALRTRFLGSYPRLGGSAAMDDGAPRLQPQT
jgi:prephenate dehydratase